VCANGTCTTACQAGTHLCGGGCCQGNACCGSKCQTKHSNGIGQNPNFFDCRPLGIPGQPSTYNLALALEARSSYPLSGAKDGLPYQGCGDSDIVVRYNGTQYAVWAYTGSLAGRVSVNAGAPVCPTVASPAWG
jgi:hypothetical protein